MATPLRASLAPPAVAGPVDRGVRPHSISSPSSNFPEGHGMKRRLRIRVHHPSACGPVPFGIQFLCTVVLQANPAAPRSSLKSCLASSIALFKVAGSPFETFNAAKRKRSNANSSAPRSNGGMLCPHSSVRSRLTSSRALGGYIASTRNCVAGLNFGDIWHAWLCCYSAVGALRW